MGEKCEHVTVSQPWSVVVVVPEVLAVMPCLLIASTLLALVATPEREASS